MTTVQQTERESERRAVETCAPVRRAAATCAALYAGYVAAAATSALVFGSSQASAFFLPAGVTVATLLLTRRRLWPLLLATIVVAELSVDLIVVGLPGQTMAGSPSPSPSNPSSGRPWSWPGAAAPPTSGRPATCSATCSAPASSDRCRAG